MSLHGNVQVWAQCSGPAWFTGPWGVTVAGQPAWGPHARGLRPAQNVPKFQIPARVCGERRCSVLHPSLTALHNLIARREQPMQTAAELIAPVWRQLWGTPPPQILSSSTLRSPASHHHGENLGSLVLLSWLWGHISADLQGHTSLLLLDPDLRHSLGAPTTVSQDLQELLQHQRGHGLHQHLCALFLFSSF